MIALPLGLGGVKLTVNGPAVEVAVPGAAFTLAAGAGEPTITGGDGGDAKPAPRAFVAFTDAGVGLGSGQPDDRHRARRAGRRSGCAAVARGARRLVARRGAAVVDTGREADEHRPGRRARGARRRLHVAGGEGDPTITAGEAADAGLEPIAFVAVTVHVYVLAAGSPVTVIGLCCPLADPAAPPSLETHATP